jgi:four helix bundle protein
MALYKNLDAWQSAMSLVTACYTATKPFPREELFGVTSQLRRAAVSIPSNIAEGACRKSDRANANHIAIALGSHAELETLLEIALRLGYTTPAALAPVTEACARTGQLLNGLFRSVKRGSQAPDDH